MSSRRRRLHAYQSRPRVITEQVHTMLQEEQRNLAESRQMINTNKQSPSLQTEVEEIETRTFDQHWADVRAIIESDKAWGAMTAKEKDQVRAADLYAWQEGTLRDNMKLHTEQLAKQGKVDTASNRKLVYHEQDKCCRCKKPHNQAQAQSRRPRPCLSFHR
jgi:hypothetical protein